MTHLQPRTQCSGRIPGQIRVFACENPSLPSSGTEPLTLCLCTLITGILSSASSQISDKIMSTFKNPGKTWTVNDISELWSWIGGGGGEGVYGINKCTISITSSSKVVYVRAWSTVLLFGGYGTHLYLIYVDIYNTITCMLFSVSSLVFGLGAVFALGLGKILGTSTYQSG